MAANPGCRDDACCDAMNKTLKLRKANKKLQTTINQLGEQLTIMDDQYTKLELELLSGVKKVVPTACESLQSQSPAKTTPPTYLFKSVPCKFDSSEIDDNDNIPLGWPVMKEYKCFGIERLVLEDNQN